MNKASNQPFRPVSEVDEGSLSEIARREPSSIRELQNLYGYLYLLGKKSTTSSIPVEYQSILTPDKLSDLGKEDGSVVYVDLELDETTQTVEYLGITTTGYTDGDNEELGYAYYDASRGHDNSITKLSGETTPPETVAKYAAKMFSLWPSEKGVKDTADAHENGWLIDALYSLGQNSELLEDIRDDVEKAIDGEQYRVVSVRFKHPDGTPDTGSEAVEAETWTYPGDHTVLLEAAKQRQFEKWARKNEGNAQGEGTCYVTNEDGSVYGSSPSPLNLYTDKKKMWLPRFSGDDGHRVNPISEEAAIGIKSSEAFTKSLYAKWGGGRIHVFPYFQGEQTVAKTKDLYTLLWSLHEDAKDRTAQSETDGPQTTIQTIYEKAKALDLATPIADLSIWTLFIGFEGTGTRVRALEESPSTDLEKYAAVVDAATEVADWQASGGESLLSTPPFDPTGNADDGYYFWHPEESLAQAVATPDYFTETVGTPNTQDTNASSNHPAFRFWNNLTRGRPIKLTTLLDAYSDHLNDRWTYNIKERTENEFPETTALNQYFQLLTLDAVGLIDHDISIDDKTAIQQFRQTILSMDSQPGPSGIDATPDSEYAELEAKAYRAFLDDHPLLSDPERRAAFTLGALITTLAGHQQYKNERPITSKYGPQDLTKQTLKGVVTEVVQGISRTAERDGKVMRYDEMTTQLAEDMEAAPPDTWDLTQSDLQFHVSMGYIFGGSAREYPPGTSEQSEENEEDNAEPPEAN